MRPSPHDALFKRVFSDPVNAAGELRSVLPAPLVTAMDFSTLALCPGDFVDKTLGGRHTDVLYSVRVGNDEAFVYVVLEHQSTVDPLMPFRMLVYVTRIWERWLRDNEEARRLPAIVPVVVHHSETGWTGATTVIELIDLPPDLLDVVQPYLPALTLHVDDMTTFSRLALALLRAVRGGRLDLSSLHWWRSALHELVATAGGMEMIEAILRYIHQVLGDRGRDVVTFLVAEDASGRVKEAYMTLYEKILGEGRKEGRRQGRKEGRKEGRQEGLRKLVTRLAELKLGPLPEDARARVERASAADLERWAERILTASRLEDLWS